MSDIQETLKQRGEQYGDFSSHADISQTLKQRLRYAPNLSPIHREALEMIFHKIARILNGNPNHWDSWHDIAGYATLVADRVKTEAEKAQLIERTVRLDGKPPSQFFAELDRNAKFCE